MKSSPPAGPSRRSSIAHVARTALTALLLAAFQTSPALAQASAPAATPRAPAPAKSVAGPNPSTEQGPRWQKLKPAQREALEPLQQEWPTIDALRKQKWLQLADRMAALPADEKARIQDRMSNWARLSPAERGQARLRFEESKQIPPPDRRSRWEAYQALTPEEKSELAARAAAARSANAAGNAARRAPSRGVGGEKPAHESSQARSSSSPNPAHVSAPRAVGPTVVQAVPGATTTLITRRPAPPAHQRAGLPKIAATPEFVNKATLLPQRGPQGVPARPKPVDDAGSAVRR